MTRLLILCHRYLGIVIGALMALWCVSGVVMMYVSYPALDEGIRLSHLAQISWNGCCSISDELAADSAAAGDLRIEMLNGRAVLAMGNADARPQLADLISGASMAAISAEQAANVAQTYISDSPTVARPASPVSLGTIGYDQWTVAGDFETDRPLYHYSLGDSRRTELYVSSATGRAVQLTTGRQRFWNWLGAVPHWLYFAQLRRSASLWSEVVIWSSLTGCFLTAIGLYIGAHQMLHQSRGRWSPYRGFKLWHHIAGLLFGLFTLTWVLSGLLSMSPWGWLEGAGPEQERALLRGADPSGAQLGAALHALGNNHPSSAASLQLAPLDGRVYFVASASDGTRWRIDESGHPAPLVAADLSYIADSLKGSGPPDTPQLVTHEETYYFSHHSAKVLLPAYRLAARDGSGTLYYVDPVSGGLLAKIDRRAQGYRWWHQALHRLDFVPALRSRPLWDLLMLVLMSGVTVTCMSGAYLGYRRLTRQRG